MWSKKMWLLKEVEKNCGLFFLTLNVMERIWAGRECERGSWESNVMQHIRKGKNAERTSSYFDRWKKEEKSEKGKERDGKGMKWQLDALMYYTYVHDGIEFVVVGAADNVVVARFLVLFLLLLLLQFKALLVFDIKSTLSVIETL